MAIFRGVRRLFSRVSVLADLAMVVGVGARAIRQARANGASPSAALSQAKKDFKANPQLMVAALAVLRMLLRRRKNRRRLS